MTAKVTQLLQALSNEMVIIFIRQSDSRQRPTDDKSNKIQVVQLLIRFQLTQRVARSLRNSWDSCFSQPVDRCRIVDRHPLLACHMCRQWSNVQELGYMRPTDQAENLVGSVWPKYAARWFGLTLSRSRSNIMGVGQSWRSQIRLWMQWSVQRCKWSWENSYPPWLKCRPE